jgi:NAD(P)-dependent dehydrogenase (short-subunit alcohol dehydrogenase family)
MEHGGTLMFDLTGRVALVTGAGQGVGAGIATALARQGATVVVNDARVERARATADAIGGSATIAPFDVTDYEAVAAAVEAIEAEHGGVDILVNNAGNGGVEGMTPTPFRESDPASWAGPINVNLYGVLNCCRAVINPMCERGWGRVITISSGAGIVGLHIGVSSYGAGKGGGLAFMRHLAIESARRGVTVNTLALGLMGVQGAPNDTTASLARQIPVGRLGTADDIGAACVYLASNEASWMTGQTIQINGGAVTT